MTVRPIGFSTPMVRALLEGRKTQTRRIHLQRGQGFEVGDRLYVREAWRAPQDLDHRSPSELLKDALEAGYSEPWCPRIFEADGTVLQWGDDWPCQEVGRLRQAMHLPRALSRITLFVEAVRLEQLQDISEDDAAAEGAFATRVLPDGGLLDRPSFGEGFRGVWKSIHGEESWDANPWVRVLSFSVALGNVDRLGVKA